MLANIYDDRDCGGGDDDDNDDCGLRHVHDDGYDGHDS